MKTTAQIARAIGCSIAFTDRLLKRGRGIDFISLQGIGWFAKRNDADDIKAMIRLVEMDIATQEGAQDDYVSGIEDPNFQDRARNLVERAILIHKESSKELTIIKAEMVKVLGGENDTTN